MRRPDLDRMRKVNMAASIDPRSPWERALWAAMTGSTHRRLSRAHRLDLAAQVARGLGVPLSDPCPDHPAIPRADCACPYDGEEPE